MAYLNRTTSRSSYAALHIFSITKIWLLFDALISTPGCRTGLVSFFKHFLDNILSKPVICVFVRPYIISVLLPVQQVRTCVNFNANTNQDLVNHIKLIYRTSTQTHSSVKPTTTCLRLMTKQTSQPGRPQKTQVNF